MIEPNPFHLNSCRPVSQLAAAHYNRSVFFAAAAWDNDTRLTLHLRKDSRVAYVELLLARFPPLPPQDASAAQRALDVEGDEVALLPSLLHIQIEWHVTTLAVHDGVSAPAEASALPDAIAMSNCDAPSDSTWRRAPWSADSMRGRGWWLADDPHTTCRMR